MLQFDPMPVREGDLLAGKYRVERVIGSGGMGVVVAARHEELGQLVAIKLVRGEALERGDTAERFLREARAAVRLRSEHVARVLDVGKLESGAPYMVMEYLEGHDLGHVLSEEGPMAVDAAVLLILQACEAVAEAHLAGIVHRDLKPQNLFLTHTLTGSPRLKVLDFGVSKSMGMTDGHGALTRTRAMLGSPLYMAPEQMRSSRDVDARADVWALGVVLFELLSGRWPFEAESMPELCLKVVTEPPRPLTDFRPDVAAGFVSIIDRCLQKEPAARYANANELAVALEPFAPPMLSRMATDRPRTTGPIGATQYIEVSRPTLASANSVPQASEPFPSAWGATPPNSPQKRRSRALPLALVLVTLGVAATGGLVHLTRRPASMTMASATGARANTVVLPPPPPPVAPDVPTATLIPLVEVAHAASSDLVPEGGVWKREMPAYTARPAGRPSAAMRARPQVTNQQGAVDDDIPALR